eukprot:2586447-Rhodomonas_salina.1
MGDRLSDEEVGITEYVTKKNKVSSSVCPCNLCNRPVLTQCPVQPGVSSRVKTRHVFAAAHNYPSLRIPNLFRARKSVTPLVCAQVQELRARDREPVVLSHTRAPRSRREDGPRFLRFVMAKAGCLPSLAFRFGVTEQFALSLSHRWSLPFSSLTSPPPHPLLLPHVRHDLGCEPPSLLVSATTYLRELSPSLSATAYASSATFLRSSAVCLRGIRYLPTQALRSTYASSAICLCAHYAMSGTDSQRTVISGSESHARRSPMQ